MSPRLGLQDRRSSDNPDRGPETEQTLRRQEGIFSASGVLREYVDGRTFLLGDGSADYVYRRTRSERQRQNRDEDQTRTDLFNRIALRGRIGAGIGRVRVVTPVIRALRARERLRTVAPDASMSNAQVQTAARQLARRPGYDAVYDRPDKAFWRDFFEQVGLGERSPFETFYVADILREPVGVRREGWDLEAGPSASYLRFLLREEEDGRVKRRKVRERQTIGAFARGRWYRNLTLRHQLGFDTEATYAYFLENTDPVCLVREARDCTKRSEMINRELDLDVEGQWLWVLADRFRFDNRLFSTLSYRHSSALNEYLTDNRYGLSSNLVVFIENSLSLSLGGTLAYEHVEDSQGTARSGINVRAQFDVTYFLSRSLR